MGLLSHVSAKFAFPEEVFAEEIHVFLDMLHRLIEYACDCGLIDAPTLLEWQDDNTISVSELYPGKVWNG